MQKKREENGITLVALVVTIIILLILAGITVVSLTGENGLIGKSGEAKKQTEISEGLEQLEIAVTQSTNKRGNIDEAKLAKNLSKINGLKYINSENEEIDVTENTDIKLTAKVKLKGNTFKINSEGNVAYKRDGIIDIEDIVESPANYYGYYVTNYNSPNDVGILDGQNQLGKWQIFMADEDNIYIIASNYITRKYTGTKNNVGFGYDTAKYTEETATIMNFLSISSEYNANSNTTDIPDILSKLKKPSIYHVWMNNPENQIKNLAGEKAIASMLDIDIWNGYNNATYAEYAIGGPSVEMFCKAYNDSHTGENLEYEVVNGIDRTNAYKMRKGTGDFSLDINGLKTDAINENADNMFFKSTSMCSRYYIASPSITGNYHRIIHIGSTGVISREFYSHNTAGFRPIVCLKSNVHLVKNADGETYSLELD